MTLNTSKYTIYDCGSLSFPKWYHSSKSIENSENDMVFNV